MAEEKAQPQVQLLANYIKDVSFENIGLQNDYIAKAQPQFEMNLNINQKKLKNGSYEVSLIVKVKATDGDQTVFVLDLDHAGRFNIANVEEAQIVPFLYIECPRILFPYTRRIVSQLTLDGGLLPLNLDNIDFVQMFKNSIEAAQAQKKS